jgi:hypothetical protein
MREQDDAMNDIRDRYERITLPGDIPFVAAVDFETYIAEDGLLFEAEASVFNGHNDTIAVFADAEEATLYAALRNAYHEGRLAETGTIGENEDMR